MRFRVDIEDVPLHFRLLLLRSDAPLVARALATLPQVQKPTSTSHVMHAAVRFALTNPALSEALAKDALSNSHMTAMHSMLLHSCVRAECG